MPILLTYDQREALIEAWTLLCKRKAEGDSLEINGAKLWVEGAKLAATSTATTAEGERLRAVGKEFEAEGDEIYAQGERRTASGQRLWAEAILAVIGDVPVIWRDGGCEVEGVFFGPVQT